MNTYTVDLDFDRDFVGMLTEELREHGYPLTGTEDPRDLKIQYFNFKKRLVPAVMRRVQKAAGFTCPAGLEPGLNAVVEKIKQGDDLKPYLSTKLKDLDYPDAMLNDWGIYHLHLGTTLESNGFMSRTGPVLYVRFDMTDAYLINVIDHGAWTDQELVRTLWRSWPASLEGFRMKGIVGMDFIPTDADVKKLRKAQTNTFVEVEKGVFLAPIGGGHTMSSRGVGIDVVRAMMSYDDLVRGFEKAVRGNKDPLGALLKEKYGLAGEHMVFSLCMINGEYLAVEQQTRVGFPLD